MPTHEIKIEAATKIAAINDHARCTFEGCRVIITQGVQALDDMETVLFQVQMFDQFNPKNDPYKEHDFGQIQHQGQIVFWKFDYFDLDLSMYSPDPSEPAVTARVLTIMLAEEY